MIQDSKNTANPFVWSMCYLGAAALQLLLLYFLQHSATDQDAPPPTAQHRPLRAQMVPIRRTTPPPKPPAEPLQGGQVVDLPQPLKKQTPPPDARYLSRYDTQVDKERKARDPGPSKGRSGDRQIEEPSEMQSPQSDQTAPSQVREPGEEIQLPQSTSELPKTSRGTLLSNDKRGRLLLPAASQASEIENLQALSAGHFASDDALLDVDEEGDSTLLNSQKFRYWDFFNRVKERVRQQWRPDQVYRQRDPTGQVFGISDRLTVLRVTLDDKGNLSNIVTLRNSGANFLDDEARRAFRAAGPFPNPPVGLLDANGLITFKFGFLFEISSSSYRFFWKRM